MMNDRSPKILLIGYGNPGRLDDGLGPALAAAVECRQPAGVTVDSDYQLTVEAAAAVAEHDAVIFADAATSGPAPFSFVRIEPELSASFSTHSVLPPAVLGLAKELFGRDVPGYCLGIRGYEFNEYREELSAPARANLAAALEFVTSVLNTRDFEKVAAALHAAGEKPNPETP
jgi:hydrogenase maturation protease